MVLPVSIAFYGNDVLEPHWLSINIIVDFLFVVDIIVIFRTGLIDKRMPNETVSAIINY